MNSFVADLDFVLEVVIDQLADSSGSVGESVGEGLGVGGEFGLEVFADGGFAGTVEAFDDDEFSLYDLFAG